MSQTLDQRKSDHLRLALRAQTEAANCDSRFYYEPFLSGHPQGSETMPLSFGPKHMQYPLWISSMTGGTEAAYTINTRLAEVCARFGLGMGLGSCRPLLESRTRWKEFALRGILGSEVPFFANLGIAQVEQLLEQGAFDQILQLVQDLEADGLIIHVNPLQELFQPEGDRFRRPPLEVVEEVLSLAPFPVIVKEVGQGFGPASLEKLLQLPLLAIDFGSFGGTNFSKLEQERNPQSTGLEPLAYVGHTAEEMLRYVIHLHRKLAHKVRVQHLIISGGIRNFLDGYYLIYHSPIPAVFGQASGFLRYASESPEALDRYVRIQVLGLLAARAFLVPKPFSSASDPTSQPLSSSVVSIS